MDVITLKMVVDKSKSAYGSAALWKTIALGPGSLLCGYFLDHFGNDAIYIWSGTCAVIMVYMVMWKAPAKLETKQGAKRNVRDIIRMFVANTKDKRVYFVLLHAFLYGLVLTLVESIFYLQLKSEFHLSTSFAGQVILVGTIIEWPVYHFSSAMLIRFGHKRLILFAHCIMAVRLLLLALVHPDITFVDFKIVLLVINLLHGFCSAVFWVSLFSSLFSVFFSFYFFSWFVPYFKNNSKFGGRND